MAHIEVIDYISGFSDGMNRDWESGVPAFAGNGVWGRTKNGIFFNQSPFTAIAATGAFVLEWHLLALEPLIGCTGTSCGTAVQSPASDSRPVRELLGWSPSRKEGGHVKKQSGAPSAKSALLATGIDYLNLRKRSDLDREVTRRSITSVVRATFTAVFPDAAEDCRFQETSSGVNAIFPRGMLNSDLLVKFLPKLELGLEELNNRCSSSTTFRLRAVFHLSEGAPATSRSAVAGRLLGSNFLRLFVTALPKERSVAVLVSDEFYRSALPPRIGIGQEFKRARIQTEAKIPITVWAYRYPTLEA